MIQPLHRLPEMRLLIPLALVMAMLAAPALAQSPDYNGSRIFQHEKQKEKKKKNQKKQSARELYSEARNILDNEHYQDAIEKYDRLQSEYPFSRYASQAQLEMAYAYYKQNKAHTALAIVRRFTHEHPSNPNVAYAYYLRGLVHFNQAARMGSKLFNIDGARREIKFAQQAFRSFDNMIQRFPDSRYASDARQRMISLKDELARRQWHIAQYYMHRRAWLSANRRARRILKNFQDTQWANKALKIMEKSYRKLDLDKAADHARQVWKANSSQQGAENG